MLRYLLGLTNYQLFTLWFGCVFLVVPAVLGAVYGDMSDKWSVMAHFDLGMLGQCLLLFVLVLALSFFFIMYCPLGKVSWISYILRHSKDEKERNLKGTNLLAAPLTLPKIWILFWIAFVLQVPALSMAEEKVFRYGDYGLWDGLLFSALFGLVHWLVGVPFGVALALIMPGFYFMLQSRVGGIELSAAYHSTYNLLVLSVLFLMLLLQDLLRSKPDELPTQS